MNIWKSIKRNPGVYVTLAFVVGVCVYLFIVNVSDEKFTSASIIDIVTILLGVFVAFFLAERMNDKRRRDDCIEHAVLEIEQFMEDDSNFKMGRGPLMKQASCANRIQYLKKASFKDIQEDISFIETHFNAVRDLYSNHNSTEEELNNIKIDLDGHRSNIADKCNKIRISLYS